MPTETEEATDPATASDPALTSLRHDLRTPIGHIIGYAEMIREDAADQGQTVSPDLDRIEAAGRRLLELVDERLSEMAGARTAPRATPPRNNTVVTPTLSPSPEMTGIILVVDNDEANRDVLTRLLGRLGHHAVQAVNGTEALALAREQVFDLMLLDVQMPGISGIEVLRQAKNDPELNHLPIIMVSAADEIEDVAMCIELGAEDYLPKPYNSTLLRARIDASLRAKRARDREKHLTDEVQTNYDKLKEAERQRDDLTGMIVHDLRTPLTSVLSGLQTLELIGGMDADQQEMLTISVDGAQTLLGMINDLLDIAKLEDGSLKLEISDVDAKGLIDHALRQVALLARERDLHLEESIADGITTFRGDEDKLRRTLVNLIGNALKFTPTGGTVTVGARRDSADEMIFYVQDTGEGIPADAFGRIFEKFGQVESRKAGRKMSTGLGLTFCKMAVEAHGGRIWVESELGVGSKFLFALPA